MRRNPISSSMGQLPAPRPSPAIVASTRLAPWMIASIVLAKANCWLLWAWIPTSLPVAAELQVLLHQELDLFGVQRAEAVDDDHLSAGVCASTSSAWSISFSVTARRPSGWR